MAPSIDHVEKINNNNNNKNNIQNGLCLQLSLSAMAIYPFPFLPTPCLDATRDPKRFKPNPNNNNFGFRDHVLTYNQRYMEAEAVEDAITAAGAAAASGGGGATGGEMRLVRLLIACAEAVACRDRAHAGALLAELRPGAPAFGSPFQRVASCFAQGLSDRLAAVEVNPLTTAAVAAPRAVDREALGLAYEVCPHIRFGHHVANRAILEAFERELYVHVIDLGMSLGLATGQQWRELLLSLAARAETHPVKRVRITAVGLDQDLHRAIGEDLGALAKTLELRLEFKAVRSTLEDLRKEDVEASEEDVIVVNSVLQLHRVVKESRGALNLVLRSLHELRPRALVVVEQDSSHNGPFFLGRFMEALHYYSAIFDSLDATLPRYDTRRAKVEQFFFAEEIKNIVSCEGPYRVERHERVDQWRRRMSRAGFQAAPIKAAAAAQARTWLGEQGHAEEAREGYTVVEEKGCLVLGWKSRPIVAVSCWKC